MKAVIFLILSIVFIAGCSHDFQTAEETVEDIIENQNAEDVVERLGANLETDTTYNWMDTELKDVRTGETFKISDFKGKNILIESFAAWCPTCTKQQNKMRELQAIDPETIHISLDTDPNEDIKIVQNYIDRNLFDWYFALAPEELTRALIKEFGVGIVFAPAAPVVLICPDQSTRFLGRGVKSANELKSEIEAGC